MGSKKLKLKDLKGLKEKDAKEKIKDAGMKFRVICKNGKVSPGTMDFNKNRVKLIIEKGKVKDTKIG